MKALVKKSNVSNSLVTTGWDCLAGNRKHYVSHYRDKSIKEIQYGRSDYDSKGCKT